MKIVGRVTETPLKLLLFEFAAKKTKAPKLLTSSATGPDSDVQITWVCHKKKPAEKFDWLSVLKFNNRLWQNLMFG